MDTHYRVLIYRGYSNVWSEIYSFSVNTIKIFISCNKNMQILVLCAVRIVPDPIFFTAQRSENISFIFSLVKIENLYFTSENMHFISLIILYISLLCI